ncbi:hypothetical protein [Desulfofundulus thermocisternus]|uniref:hypothetical protein n=1 Tax=Desulfofundulus thermocisternus TaxID=42471 RepID=UPI0004837FDF|nr:hypothetical protein [Desulfofundulus thermocisternus]
MRFWPIVTLAVIFLLIRGENHLAVSNPIKMQYDDIYAVVKGAVEDKTWWQARNIYEVREKLGKYYAEPILSAISKRAWNFISQPTDWYVQTFVSAIYITSISTEKVTLKIDMVNKDLISGQIQEGTGYFSLHKTSSGWRIISADYRWEKESNTLGIKSPISYN